MTSAKMEWQLDKYFYSGIKDEKIKKDLQVYKDKLEKFISDYENKIWTLSDEQFLQYLEGTEDMSKEIEIISTFLFLASSLDTQDQSLQKETTKLEKMLSDTEERLLFVDEEYKIMGFKSLERISQLEMMKSFKEYIRSEAETLRYLLSKLEEKVYIKLATASSSNLYEEVVTSLQFEFNGEKKTLDEILAQRESTDKHRRECAWNEVASVIKKKQNQIIFGNLYSLVCKGNVADVELRDLETVMKGRNISESISDETVNILLDTIQNNYGLFHRYLKVKAKFFGGDTLKVFDIFAPYPISTIEKKISFEEGWKLYRDTIEKVDPALGAFSDEMLNEGRISVYPKPGKTGGAYAMYSKFIPEFVLLNWTDTPGDVATLAHELGHAFHGNLSKVQKEAVYDTPLTLAETASIFNETIMFETLLETIDDKELKKKMISSRLDDIFGTIFRQIAYVNFEKRCHESFQNNEPLTYDDYNEMWLDEMKKLYGESVDINPELIKYNWIYISHIFESPFYCYTYAFGNIISLNIYQNYKDSDNKEEFIKKYHTLLAAGGSDTPENLLNDIFGIKFDDKFYQTAFKNIEDLIVKLEE